MKKTRKFLITLLLLLCSIFALCGFSGCNVSHASSTRTVKDGIIYKKVNNNYYVSSCDQSKTEATIESFIRGLPVTSIGSRAFENCTNLTSITIPDSVTSIGSRAFYSCENLVSITIPDSVTSIDSWTFENCNNLTSITIPDSVTSIGSGAFYSCENLVSITIPDSVTSIGSSAFENCNNLTSITIPDSVTSIASWTFENCNNLTSITIPDSVTSIGSRAFANCNGLESVYLKNIEGWCSIDFDGTYANPLYYAKNLYINNQLVGDLVIPNSVTKISDHAFRGCDSLVSVKMSDSITSIGKWAFYDCGNLTSVVLSNAITDMGEDVFGFCESLNYNEYDNAYYLGDDTHKYSILVKPNNNDIKKIEILPETKFVFSSAFSDCKSLQTVYITDLESWCNITFSDTLSNPLCNGADLYLNNQMVTDLVIPDSVSIIKESSFFNCTSLMNITIPKSVTYIDRWAFYGCHKLTNVLIPDSVDTIRYGVFGACTSLEAITLPFVGRKATETEEACWNVFGYIFGDTDFDDKMNWSSTYYMTSDASDYTSQVYDTEAKKYFRYIIPKSLKSVTITSAKTIPDYAFKNCDLLESIYLPISVESIGDDVFVNCSKATIYCERKMKPNNWSSDWNYISYSNSAPVVWNCSQEHDTTKDGFQFVKLIGGELCITGYEGTLSDIIIPETINGCKVTHIFERAFFDCDNLTSVTLPNSIVNIGDRAFYDCNNLKNINIPKSVLSVENFAFHFCDKLTICCEATSKPSLWDSNWNSSNCPVVWGYTEEN